MSSPLSNATSAQLIGATFTGAAERLAENASSAVRVIKNEVEGMGKKVISYVSSQRQQSNAQAAFRQEVSAAVTKAFNNVVSAYKTAANFVNESAKTVQTSFTADERIANALFNPVKINVDANAGSVKKTAAKVAEKAIYVAQQMASFVDAASTAVGKYSFLSLNGVLGYLPGGTALSTLVAAVLRATTLVALTALAISAVAIATVTAIAATVTVLALAVATSPFYASSVVTYVLLNKKMEEQKAASNAEIQALRAELAEAIEGSDEEEDYLPASEPTPAELAQPGIIARLFSYVPGASYFGSK